VNYVYHCTRSYINSISKEFVSFSNNNYYLNILNRQEKCLLLFSHLWLLRGIPSERARKCDLFVQGSFVLKVLDSGTLERSRNKKKIVKMNKTHFPVLCTLIRLHYMFSDPWSSVTFDSFNRNIFDSVNANSSSQVSWKMQFAKNRVLQAIQFSINSFPSSQSLMSFSVDLRARANQNLIHIHICIIYVYNIFGTCYICNMHNKKSIPNEQWYIDCGRKHLYSNVG